jgi:replicative DNA helicase
VSFLLDADQWIERLETSGVEVALPSPPALAGMPPLVLGRATFLGGPPGGGKTTLALQYWRTSLEAGHPSAFITLEMTPTDLFRRFALQFDSEEECKDWLRTYEAKVGDVSLGSDEVEKVILDGEFDLVIVDHVHEFDFTDRRELERIITRIAKLAPRTNTALLILAQLKRPAFDQDAPSKSDFRETGRIEQVASVLLQLWQDDELEDETSLWCTKSRFTARPKPIDLHLCKETVTFSVASPGDRLYTSY